MKLLVKLGQSELINVHRGYDWYFYKKPRTIVATPNSSNEILSSFSLNACQEMSILKLCNLAPERYNYLFEGHTDNKGNVTFYLAEPDKVSENYNTQKIKKSLFGTL